tara:strand:+ start:525 stop:1238 length:714 start_codon:yes stop_codon:yes gene_type:complete
MKKIFRILQPTITVVFIFIACIIYGLSLAPAIIFFNYISHCLNIYSIFLKAFCLGITFSLCFFIFGISLIFIVGLIMRFSPIKPKPGVYSIGSINSIKWGLCGAFLKLVNLAFLDFITPTFLNIIYFKLIGAKIGKNVQINSTSINDPWLLEIGDNSIIGGSASINCHTVEGGKLILDRVKIGDKCTIGAQSLIWPGCEIGNRSVLATKSVLKKRTKIGEKQIWKGNPAVNIREHRK